MSVRIASRSCRPTDSMNRVTTASVAWLSVVCSINTSPLSAARRTGSGPTTTLAHGFAWYRCGGGRLLPRLACRNRRLDTGGRCRGRGAKRLLAQQPGQRERDERNAGGGQEHRLQGGGDRMHVGRVHRGRQVLHDLRVGGGGDVSARGQLAGGLAGQPVGEDRAEGGHADRTADLPEQRRTRGGN